MPCIRPTSVKCPKCCPKQCQPCTHPTVIPRDIPCDLMDEFIEAAYQESKGTARSSSKTQCKSLSKFCDDDVMESSSCMKIPLTLPIAVQLLKNWYQDMSFETEDALHDVKCIWTSTDGDLSRKICATNRLFIYYLLVMAIYIIHICFVIDEKLFEALCKILTSRDNNFHE